MAKKSRLMVLSKTKAQGEEMQPLGSLGQIKDQLGAFNTAIDGGASASLGLDRLYGPGFVVDLPTSIDMPMQIMVAVIDDEIAWPVLSRICRTLGWSLSDAESGRVFL